MKRYLGILPFEVMNPVPNQQHIHCTVNSCHYWAAGNKCDAQEIMVTSDTLSTSKPDSYDAKMAAQAPQTPVQACEDTCCKTFVPVNSPDAPADSITRMS